MKWNNIEEENQAWANNFLMPILTQIPILITPHFHFHLNFHFYSNYSLPSDSGGT